MQRECPEVSELMQIYIQGKILHPIVDRLSSGGGPGTPLPWQSDEIIQGGPRMVPGDSSLLNDGAPDPLYDYTLARSTTIRINNNPEVREMI